MNEKPLFPPEDRRRTVKIPELAELTGIPTTTLREYVNRGEIPGAMRSGPRSRWRFDRQSLEAWWKTLPKTALIRRTTEEITHKPKLNPRSKKRRELQPNH